MPKKFLDFLLQYFNFGRKKLFTKVHFFIHLNLSIALLLSYVVFLAGVDTAVGSTIGCAFVAALLHYLFTAVFCWMLCEGIMIFLKLVLVFSSFHKKWWFFLLVGWGKTSHSPLSSVTLKIGYFYLPPGYIFGTIQKAAMESQA